MTIHAPVVTELEHPFVQPSGLEIPSYVMELWLAEVDAAMALTPDTLPPGQLEAVIAASYGVKHHTEADNRFVQPQTVRGSRHRAIENTGAKSVAQAFNRLVIAGLIEVEPIDTEVGLTDVELADIALGAIGRTRDERLSLLSTDFSKAQIAGAPSHSRRKLKTKNFPDTVRLAHATGYLPLTL